MNNWQLVKHGLSLTYDGWVQRVFIERFLKPVIVKECGRLNYSLSPAEKKKILFYYPTYTVLACAQMYLCLKGRSLNKDETMRLTMVGAMATICDDLIDEEHWSRDQIFSLLSDSINDSQLSSQRAKLLIALNQRLRAFWRPGQEYLHRLHDALEWQVVSQMQATDPSLSAEEVISISRQKNGNTSLMFASLIDQDWDETELKFIYQSAIVGQLTNDSFDVYFDTCNGIRTMFNTASTVGEVKQLFYQECKELHDLVRQSNNKGKDKLATIRRMSVLHGFTLTAIEQFEQAERLHGSPINWNKLSRKELVIDMALNKNRFRTLHHIKQLSKI